MDMNETILQDLLEAESILTEAQVNICRPVSGGCIHKAWEVEMQDGSKFFAKTGNAEAFPMLKFEEQGLKALNQFSLEKLLVVPRPIIVKKFNQTSILLMPWLNLGQGDQSNLGEGLARLHKDSSNHNQECFGWGEDGFIGSGPQPGAWISNWGECFVKLRLIPQIRIAKKWGLSIPQEDLLFSFLTTFLDAHKPKPSLVHGDLWSGNAGVQLNGKGVIFDPATWWADREVDIAMTKLFGGFSHEFYSNYEKIWPLNEFSKDRENIYNLYHLLNHANLFGGFYKSQCHSTIQDLEAKMLL